MTTTRDTSADALSAWESEFPPDALATVRGYLADLSPIVSERDQQEVTLTNALAIELGSVRLIALQADATDLRVVAVPVMNGKVVQEGIGSYLLRMNGDHIALCLDGDIDMGDGLTNVAFPVLNLNPLVRDQSGRVRQGRVPDTCSSDEGFIDVGKLIGIAEASGEDHLVMEEMPAALEERLSRRKKKDPFN